MLDRQELYEGILSTEGLITILEEQIEAVENGSYPIELKDPQGQIQYWKWKIAQHRKTIGKLHQLVGRA